MKRKKDIKNEEFKEWIRRGNSNNKETYRRLLQNMEADMRGSFDFSQYVQENGQTVLRLKPKYQRRVKEMHRDLRLFSIVKYPDIMYKAGEHPRQEEVEALLKDPEYINLVAGLDYHSTELESDEIVVKKAAKKSIKALVQQTADLIHAKFPELLDELHDDDAALPL